MEQVREVLRGIGAGEIRELVVFNKIDLSGDSPRTILGPDGAATQAWVSAVSGDGLPSLRESLAQAVRPNQVRRTLHLELAAAAVRSELYERNAVRAHRSCQIAGRQRRQLGRPCQGPRAARRLSSLVGGGSPVRMRGYF
jgi:GTP-binding protein HflX